MIKTTVTVPPQPKNDLVFPLLARARNNKIVLFTDFTVGTVMDIGVSDDELGRHEKGWLNCSNKNVWEILPKGTKVTFEIL